VLSHVSLTALLTTNGDADFCIKMRTRDSLTSAESGAGSRVRPSLRPHTDHSFGSRTGGHAGDRVAAPIGGSGASATHSSITDRAAVAAVGVHDLQEL
jgi:hypothetical protein